MPRIEIDHLLMSYPQMTVAQVNLIRNFYSIFDSRSAANRRITNVEPFWYMGTNVGSEFLTYAATKMYLCLEFVVAQTAAAPQANIPYVSFYDAANAAVFVIGKPGIYYDTVAGAPRYQPDPDYLYNFYFSRIAIAQYVYVLFNGFRITLI